MLGTALADPPDPVIFFEHVALYNTATDVDNLVPPTDISRAAIRRSDPMSR